MTHMEALLKFAPGTRIEYVHKTGLTHTDATVIGVDTGSAPDLAMLLIQYDNDPHYPGPSRVNPDYYKVINGNK
jgi:hypothetical protein